jgi:AraC-like DNA-binding protein
MTLESVVLILAAAQAFLLALLTYQKHRAVYANRFLSLMMLVCGIAMIHMLIQDNGFYDIYPSFLYIVLGIPFLVAPLHFLYTKYLVARVDNFARRDWLHFAPAVIAEVVIIAAAISFPKADTEITSRNAELVPAGFRIYNWALIASGIAYTAASLRILLKYQGTIKKIASSLESVRLGWLMYLTIAVMTVWTMFFIENTLMTFGVNLSNFVITSVCGGLYVFAIGYYGLLKSEVFAAPSVESTMHEIYQAASEETRTMGKYEKSGLDEETSTSIMTRLLELMKDKKPFTDPSLTLAQLAALLSVSPHNLSEVINTKARQNFYDFVNGYRIEQVKKDLSDPGKKNLKILSIAFDAGFNSKASFNAIFKDTTGTTPSEYRNRVLNSND